MIIGDEAYPLSNWLLKPFPDNGALTRPQLKFNRTLSSARSIVERAFGLLKVRWRCLLKRLDSQKENVISIIITCCVLHNICQGNEDELDDEDLLQRIIREQQQVNENDANMNTGEDFRQLIVNFIDI